MVGMTKVAPTDCLHLVIGIFKYSFIKYEDLGNAANIEDLIRCLYCEKYQYK